MVAVKTIASLSIMFLNKTEEWHSNVIETGPMRGYDIADVDGDMNDEIVWASADNKDDFNGGAVTHIIKMRYDTELTFEDVYNSSSNMPYGKNIKISDLVTVNINLNGRNDIVIGGSDFSKGRIFFLDGKTHEQIQNFTSGSGFDSLDVITNENKTKIVASDRKQIYVIDAQTGSLEKTSPLINNINYIATDGSNGVYCVSDDNYHDAEVKFYNLTNNHVTVEDICSGVTSGLTVTEAGDLACAVGSNLQIRNKDGNLKTFNLNCDVNGPITSSTLNGQTTFFLSCDEKFIMFQELEDDGKGSVIKEYFTGYTPWMVKHYTIGQSDYLLVGEQVAVHLYEIISNY